MSLSSLKKTILILAIIPLLALTLFRASVFLDQALRYTPELWQDEGYAWYPVEQILDGGLLNFNCRRYNSVGCYGSTQPFLDALLLKSLPASWIEKDRRSPEVETLWIYDSKYPNGSRIIRIFRALLGIGLIPLMFIWFFRARIQGWEAAALALCLSSFYSYFWSYSGVKNDFLFAWFLVAFFTLAWKSFQWRHEGFYFWCAIVIGVLGCGVKMTMTVPLVFFLVCVVAQGLSISGFKMRYKIRREFKRSVRVFAVLGVIWLIMYPNLWRSSSEASWFLIFLFPAKTGTEWGQIAEEIKTLTLDQTWPFLLLIPAVIIVLRQRVPIKFWAVAFLFLTPAVWTYLTASSATARAAYYFPILLWVFMSLGVITENIRSGIRTAIILPVILITSLGVYHSYGIERSGPSRLWSLAIPRSFSGFQLKFQEAVESAQFVFVDKNLRPFIADNLEGKNRVHLFNSLFESPEDFLNRLNHKIDPVQELVLFLPCLDLSDHQDKWDEDSPSIKAWMRAFQGECWERESLSRGHFYPMETGSKFRRVFELRMPFSEFQEAAKLASVNTKITKIPAKFSPRKFLGAEQGLDYWFSPLVLVSDTELKTSLQIDKLAKSVTFDFQSTCKGDANVEIEVGMNRKTVGLSVNRLLCERGGLGRVICSTGLSSWWTRRVPLPSVSIPVNNLPSKRLDISMHFSGLDNPDRCRVSVGAVTIN